MNTKKRIQAHIRGWLPKEPSLPVTTMAQVTQKISRHDLAKFYLTIFVTVFVTVLVTLGIFEILGLRLYSNYAAGFTAFIAAAFAIRRNQNSNVNKRRTMQ